MDYIDIILQELKTGEEESINEGWFLTTPFIAFSSMKKNIFKKLLDNKAFEVLKRATTGELKNSIKSKYEIGKEKVKHDVGLKAGSGGDATVYKLTPEQINTMSEIYDKYGSELVEEIYKFRKNVLAPYQVIKRTIKKNKQVSFKDAHGLSYDEYKSALESGRKKILKRKDFFEKNDERFESSGEYDKAMDRMAEAKKELETKGKLNDSLLNRIYQELKISDEDLGGYTPEEMKAITDELASNFTKIHKYVDAPGSTTPPEEILNALERNALLRQGKAGDNKEKDIKTIIRSVNRENIKKGNFKLAFSKYMFRKEVQDKIKSSNENLYKRLYSDLLDETLKKIKERKSETVRSSVASKISIEFNDKEKKVWELLPSVRNEYSGNLEDYRQKITDDTFKDVKHIQKPEGLEKAQQEVENEIKRFERRLSQILDKEDVDKLKKYRLINNMLTVREMIDPSDMFKSSAELGAIAAETPETKENFIPEDEFHRRLKEYATMEYDTMNELNKAKKQAEALVATIKAQGDGELAAKYANIIRQIKDRRTTDPVKIQGSSFTYGEILTVNDIEQFAKNMIKKTYSSIDEIKQDKIIFDKMLEKYKKEEPEAESNLNEIDFLLKQVARKFQGELGNYFGSSKGD